MNENERVAMTIMAQIKAQDSAAFKKWEAYNFVPQGEGEDWFGNKFRGALGFQVKGTKLPRGKVHIQLDWLDTYRIMFIDQDPEKLMASEDGMPPCEVMEGIYFDQLVEVIDDRVRNKPNRLSQRIITDISSADFTAMEAWKVGNIMQYGPGMRDGKRHKGGVAFKFDGGFVAFITLSEEDHYRLGILMDKPDEEGKPVVLVERDDLDPHDLIREIDKLAFGDPLASVARMIENLKAEVGKDAQRD